MSTSANPASISAARAFSANRFFSVLRMGLWATQAMSPRWASRAAARIFCTPIPTKLATRHFMAPAGVRVESLPFERTSLTLYHWPAAEGAPQVLLTHGWGGWGLQMAALAEALSAAGWAPVVIDQPAHGRSDGWSSTLPQFVRALSYVSARLGRVEALVGHSMGGSAAAIAVANGLAVRRLVLIASPTSMLKVTYDYARAFRLSERTRTGMVLHLESREGMVFERMDSAMTAPRVHVPTLIVHDSGDTTVPHAEGRMLAEQLPDARLLTTEGLGHRRLLKDAVVVDAVAQFFRTV